MSVYRFRKEELEAHLNRNALWAIVYGDMMSYLMIMFLVLLSYQLSRPMRLKEDRMTETLMEIQRVFGGKVETPEAKAAQEQDKFMFTAQKVREAAAEQDLGDAVKVVVTEKWAKFDLKDEFLFDSGSAELKGGSAPLFDMIAKNMVSKENIIQVEGHTDDRPLLPGSRYKSNWELSMARAYAVIQQLQASGVDPKQLSGSGYGEYQPIADNATAEGRAKNRRIEVKILRASE
ncbi:MAG: OmpA family protein [Elusimicrobiota bacterium]